MGELYFPKQSYLIVGILYDIYNELGFGYQEKYYYRAIKNRLIKAEFKVKEQLPTKLVSDGKIIDRYFLDFLIDDCIVLELKVAEMIYPRHIKQVIGYLKANNLNLGILAVFSKSGVIIKRVLN
jgi:GxxExxY protein